MQMNSYDDILGGRLSDARDREREAIIRSVEMLKQAKAAGPRSREAVDALHYLDRLWSLLLDDLAHADNLLPKELKASLISIGIWILREIEQIRTERSDSLAGLIDVSEIISQGLGQAA